MLSLLDAQCATGCGPAKDLSFLSTVHRSHARHASFARTHPSRKQCDFGVRHFADEVPYCVAGEGSSSWTEANLDAVPEGIAELLAHSTKPLFTEIGGSEKVKTKKRKTVAAGFCSSMNSLRETLQVSLTDGRRQTFYMQLES